MPIYGKCPVCKGETQDYSCVSCMYDEIERLKETNESLTSLTRNQAAEIERLKWRLNHQTEDDVRQGRHHDCGAA